VGDYARDRYHFSLSNIPTNGSTFGRTLPKYYARVSEFTFYPKDTSQSFSGYFRSHCPEVFGSYYLIEYFFYFVFNDAWNMHQSDWDSMVKIYINRQNGRMYVATHMHHAKWISQWPVASPVPDLKTWLGRWNNVKKRDLGEVFVRGNHPYVFVALQAHGSYPTPGFTMHGIDFPRAVTRNDVLITADERYLGGTCVVPGGINTDGIRAELEVEDVNVARLRFYTWKAPELVDNQPWLKYKGLWGDVSTFLGWSGPKNPPISTKRTRDENWKAFGKDLQFQLADGHRSRTVLDSWHGVQ
jgi:hypothetical protein